MSLMQTVTADCPACGTKVTAEFVSSINADRRPDLRQQILDGSLQVVSCPNCQTEFRMVPHLAYIDFDRGQWILVHPTDALERWPELEQAAQRTFDGVYGSGAPTAARELGATMTARLVFGWPPLREKLICRELGLDDIELELLKIGVLRDVPSPPATDDTELRLVGAEGDDLLFSWIAGGTGAVLTSLRVPKSVYDEIAADRTDWAELRGALTGGVFVDFNRLLVA
jgi:endogenous inhibitor of DNA gyrase (YacG/DUF329 family)